MLNVVSDDTKWGCMIWGKDLFSENCGKKNDVAVILYRAAQFVKY